MYRTLPLLFSIGLALGARSFAAPAPSARCEAAKLRATAQRTLGVLRCRVRGLAKSEGIDPACVAALAPAFTSAFDRADAKGGCPVTGNRTAIDTLIAQLEDFAAVAFPDDGTPLSRKCAAAKLKAAARTASGLGGCVAHVLQKPTASDAACRHALDARLTKAFTNAERRFACRTVGDADAVSSHLTDWHADVVRAIATPPSTTTTTTTSTTAPEPSTTATTTTDTTAPDTTTTASVAPTTSTTTTQATTSTTTTLDGQTTTTQVAIATTTTTTSTTTTTRPTTTTTSTTTSTTTTTRPAGLSFAYDIQPIFTASCALPQCHVSPNPAQYLDLRPGVAWAAVVGVASTEKPALKMVKVSGAANDYSKSYLYQKLINAGTILGSKMPNNGTTLTAAQIDLVKQWIQAGAPNN